MYVRDAKNRDEPWLLEGIESMGLDSQAFRSRDYVIAVDETSNTRVGFGRLRIHPDDPDVCELTGNRGRPRLARAGRWCARH